MKDIRIEIVTDEEAFHPIDCRIGDMVAQMSIEELVELNRQSGEVIDEYHHRAVNALLERRREVVGDNGNDLYDYGLIDGITY